MKRAIRSICRGRLRDGQKGAIALEMAIALPLFAILLTGIFEFGRMTMDHQILQNAAREGARYSSLPSQQGAITAVQDRVIAYLATDGIAVVRGDVAVDQAVNIAIGGLTVHGSNVTVTYSRPVLFNGSTTFFGLGPVVLKGNAVFRNFY